MAPVLVDDVITLLGTGRTQCTVFVLLSLMSLPAAWVVMSGTFTAVVPPYECEQWTLADAAGAPLSRDDVARANATRGDAAADPYRWWNSSASDQCSREGANGSVYACALWSYEEIEQPSIVAEWDLVCDRAVLCQVSSAVVMAGCMAGSLVCPFLSDSYGRRPTTIVFTWLFLALGVANAFVDSYTGYVVVRGFLVAAVQASE
ncbi:PREDICTED: organic cation transporter protein-like [Priapulus caudatus]|uniref:Organic cation transporter protein-like n=1 Tax=Priapulus caudatus TaxID=37621 RepID=A0ABM1ENA6_PRICU|nr:PREDICTED: organic cation transporter protein-like [Priapulus caudatus]